MSTKISRYFALILILAAFGSAKASVSQIEAIVLSPDIFQINSSNCGPNQRDSWSQTGFRVKGTVGIYTALHGVADCQTIKATIVGLQEQYKNLEVKEYNLAQDVALLGAVAGTSEVLPATALEKEETLPSAGDADGRWVSIIGYPKNAQSQNESGIIKIRANITSTINSIMRTFPDEYEGEAGLLEKRGSPDILAPVLFLEGVLLPGHSGAPILNRNGKVIAIANGGLRPDLEYAWGMPWNVITQTTTGKADELHLINSVVLHSEKFSQNATVEGNLTKIKVEFSSKANSNAARVLQELEIFQNLDATYPLDSQGINLNQTYHIYIKDANDAPLADGELGSYFKSAHTANLFRVDTQDGLLKLSVSTAELCKLKLRTLDKFSTSPITDANVTLTYGGDTYSNVPDSNGGTAFQFRCDWELEPGFEIEVSSGALGSWRKQFKIVDANNTTIPANDEIAYVSIQALTTLGHTETIRLAPAEKLDSLSLSGDTQIGEPDRSIILPERIVTNGYQLVIVGTTLIGSNSKIISFETLSLGNAVDGEDGEPGDPPTDATGKTGDKGNDGENGDDGLDGQSAGAIVIDVEKIEGSIEIRNVGQNGQAGGDGGNGGTGGDGAQGVDAEPVEIGGVYINCDSGPGHGGNGGIGGDGGDAGGGGAGGNGGEVTINVRDLQATIFVYTPGGTGGRAGLPGKAGNGGNGGAPGDPVHSPCTAEPDRRGNNGSDGNRGEASDDGGPGEAGEIVVTINGETTTYTDGEALVKAQPLPTSTAQLPSREPDCLHNYFAGISEEKIIRVPYNSHDYPQSITASGDELTLGPFGIELERSGLPIAVLRFEILPDWTNTQNTQVLLKSFLAANCTKISPKNASRGGELVFEDGLVPNFHYLEFTLGEERYELRIKVGSLESGDNVIKVDFHPSDVTVASCLFASRQSLGETKSDSYKLPGSASPTKSTVISSTNFRLHGMVSTGVTDRYMVSATYDLIPGFHCFN